MRFCNSKSKRSERGFAIVFVIAALFSLLAFFALAVDISNVHTTSNELGSAVDAMCVSLVHLIEDEKNASNLAGIAQTGILDNLKLNGLDVQSMPLPVITLTPDPSVAPPREVKIDATIDVPNYLLRLVPGMQKFTTLDASASCLSRRLVLMFILDNSDSMNWLAPDGRQKISIAKQGAIDFLSSLNLAQEDYVGFYGIGGNSASTVRKLDNKVDLPTLIDQINNLGTALGTATADGLRLAQEDFSAVSQKITLLSTDVVATILYTDGGPTRRVSVPSSCAGWQYDYPYPFPSGFSPGWAQSQYTDAAYDYLDAIERSDTLRKMGVQYYVLGIGGDGFKDPTFDCWQQSSISNGTAATLTFNAIDPFQCVNNPGAMVKNRFLSRLANAKELMKDEDNNPNNGLQPQPDFPNCVAANQDPDLGPEGSFVSSIDPVVLNGVLQSIAGSIKSLMTK